VRALSSGRFQARFLDHDTGQMFRLRRLLLARAPLTGGWRSNGSSSTKQPRSTSKIASRPLSAPSTASFGAVVDLASTAPSSPA
jgi:hypothetical protein